MKLEISSTSLKFHLEITVPGGALLNQNQTKYHSKNIDKSYPKMYFLLNVSHCVKSYGHFCQILTIYDSRSQNMVMSLDPRCKSLKIFVCPNSTFNIKKSQKISSRKALYFGSYQQKPHGGGGGGGGTPPQCL